MENYTSSKLLFGCSGSHKTIRAHMRTFGVFLIFNLLASSAWAESVEKNSGESFQQFVTRFAPKNGVITHNIIEASEWNLQTPAVIAFYEHPPAPEDVTEVTLTGYVFVPISATRYEKILIDGYGTEGGDPQIKGIFFASTDKTKDKKLIVIVSWEQNHAILQGTLYETYIYIHSQKPHPTQKNSIISKL
jgi:hypothetical protein